MTNAEPIIHQSVGVLFTSSIIAAGFRNPPLTRSEHEKRVARCGLLLIGLGFIAAYILY
ncbi:MAG TPA: hypothetical protein VL335_02010 [Candidatus Paceibacterota bacterium]|nr:hypothetical protein [Candidatus Paceibacterota bacterium]